MIVNRKRAAVILVGVCAAVVAMVWHLVANRHDTITATAQFESGAGLYVGNRVAVLGIPVGHVTKVSAKGSYAEVEFTVEEKVSIPADVKAVTLSTSILTDRQIELTPPYRGGPVLRNGDTIGLHRTTTPVEFDQVLDMLDNLAHSLHGDGDGGGPLADIEDAGAVVLTGHGTQIKTALDELSRALRLSGDGGAHTRQQLTTIIRNLSSLLDAAASNDATLREFGSTVRQLSQIVAAEDFGSGTTGKQLNEIVEQIGGIMNANRGVLKSGIGNGNISLQSMYDHQRELAEFFNVLPLMTDNLYNTVDQNNGAVRAHFLADRMLFDGQTAKEICNMMGLRQLGCSTGRLQDYGPDFGLTSMLDGLAAMGQK